MAAVIRVKRSLEEEPLDALVLNCKRLKHDETASDISTVIKFAGTVKSQDEDLAPHISKIKKSYAEANYKKHVPNVNAKVKQQVREASQNSRYKVVNYFRANVNTEDGISSTENPDESQPVYTVVDIEAATDEKAQGADNNEASTNKQFEPKYVYDLYYTYSDDFGSDEMFNDGLSIYPCSDDLVYGYAFDNAEVSNDEDESDDSNDENNWRNEYPDSDSDTIDEDDMVRAMNRCKVNGEESDLSSDAGEESFVYGIDSEGAGFEEEVDQADVWRHGEMYARFKVSMNKSHERNASNLYYGENSDESDHSDDNLDYY